jgi:hypothetical protein
MRALALTLALTCPLAPALAATPSHSSHSSSTSSSHSKAPAKPAAPAAGGPKAIGKFDDWQAATVEQAGQTACYAFTRASGSSPSVPGRGDVVLTVTQRASGRDAVAISAGFAYQPNATVTVSVDQTNLEFYTAQRSAFARDGHAAVTAFQKGSKAIAKSPAPRGSGDVSDTFSLKGFSAAYAAIDKACPAK